LYPLPTPYYYYKLQVVIVSAMIVGSSSADPGIFKNVIKFLTKWQDLNVPKAIKLTNFSNEEVAGLFLRRFIPAIPPRQDTEESDGAHVWAPSITTAAT
jgi:hypothetical protein